MFIHVQRSSIFPLLPFPPSHHHLPHPLPRFFIFLSREAATDAKHAGGARTARHEAVDIMEVQEIDSSSILLLPPSAGQHPHASSPLDGHCAVYPDVKCFSIGCRSKVVNTDLVLPAGTLVVFCCILYLTCVIERMLCACADSYKRYLQVSGHSHLQSN